MSLSKIMTDGIKNLQKKAKKAVTATKKDKFAAGNAAKVIKKRRKQIEEIK